METKTCKTCNETKPIKKFKIKSNKCNTCLNKASTYKIVNALPDSYVIKCMTYYKKIDKSTITQQQIIEYRNIMLLKRNSKTIEDKKLCWNCKTLKNKSEFSYHLGACKSCKNAKAKIWTKTSSKYKARITFYREALTDCIVKANIMGIVNKYLEKDLRIKASDIPQDFIDLKRKELTLKRKIENGNKKTNTKGS